MQSKIRNSRYFFLLLILFFSQLTFLSANPFIINVPAKETLSTEDYLKVQEQLRSIDIALLIKELLPSVPDFASYDQFYWRCSRGLKQTLVNPEKGQFPIRQLEKIGDTKDRCIVTYVTYDRFYPSLAERIPKELRKVGFNGYVLYFVGGYPNPTGKEIQYAGVPYAFKIFMMLEAHKLGFNNVMWVDAALLPLRDPTPLFHWLEKHDHFLLGFKKNPAAERNILPATRKLLKDLTGTEIVDARFLSTIVFGLKMNTPKAIKLIETYYKFVHLGMPFLSYYPEEYVLSAILGQNYYKDWEPQPYNLIQPSHINDGQKEIKKAKEKHFYFYHLQH